MVEKILNIMLIAMFATFCIVFAIKTVYIDVAKHDEDEKWDKENGIEAQNPSYDSNYTLTIDPRF